MREDNMPLFEVYLGDVRKMYANSESCIPSASTQRAMKNAGYTLKYKGKKLGRQDIAGEKAQTRS